VTGGAWDGGASSGRGGEFLIAKMSQDFVESLTRFIGDDVLVLDTCYDSDRSCAAAVDC
jgi:hypothetical protein